MNELLNVKEIRKAEGMTQTQFAEKCGVTIRTVQNWEKGGKIPEVTQRLIAQIKGKSAAVSHKPTVGISLPTANVTSKEGAATVRVVVPTDKKLVIPKKYAYNALRFAAKKEPKLIRKNEDGTIVIENVEEHTTPIPIASVQANIDTGKLSPNENTDPITAENAEVIPVVPAKIVREENVDIVEYVEKKYDDIEKITLNQLFPDVDVFHRVTSDSMVPAINPGDMVALKKITDPGLIFLGEPYALNTVSTGLFIRYITDMNETAIYCEAADEDKKPFWVEKSKITNAFAIAGYIGQNIIALDRSKVALIKEQRERIAHLETLVDTACEREKKLIDQQQKLIDFLTK